MVRLVILALLGLLILVLARPDLAGLDIDLPERDDLRLWIDAAGILGPVLVVALMTLAIVASPLPSAPIALAAGAAYGHTYGTLLVVLGAEIGALAAFLLARGLGRPFVERHVGETIGHLWRFAVATLAGVIPASFLLTHLGSEAMNGDVQTATWTALALGAFTVLSVLFGVWRDRHNSKKQL